MASCRFCVTDSLHKARNCLTREVERQRNLALLRNRKKIREEIKRLREPGIKIGDIYARIAERHGVSPSKIKQIWYKSPK